MDILKDVLGMQVVYSDWEGINSLPPYMPDSYIFRKAKIEGVSCIIMELQTDFPTLPGIRRQIKVIQSIESLPVVLQVESMSVFRRRSLIQEKIPFIISEKQIYLPFLGAYLFARDVKKREESQEVERFMYSTQQLLLWYLYQPDNRVYIAEALKVLPFTAMTLTRAARQLEATHLVEIYKDGVNKVMESKLDKLQLYESAKKYMRSPLKYQGYIDKEQVTAGMVIAGGLAEDALNNNERKYATMLKTYAVVETEVLRACIVEDLIDTGKQVKVEVWAYDPRLFARNGVADPVSVELIFAGNGEHSREDTQMEKIRNVLGSQSQ